MNPCTCRQFAVSTPKSRATPVSYFRDAISFLAQSRPESKWIFISAGESTFPWHTYVHKGGSDLCLIVHMRYVLIKLHRRNKEDLIVKTTNTVTSKQILVRVFAF